MDSVNGPSPARTCRLGPEQEAGPWHCLADCVDETEAVRDPEDEQSALFHVLWGWETMALALRVGVVPVTLGSPV